MAKAKPVKSAVYSNGPQDRGRDPLDELTGTMAVLQLAVSLLQSDVHRLNMETYALLSQPQRDERQRHQKPE